MGMISKIFGNKDEAQSLQDWINQRNTVIKGLLQDFPWLWSMNSHFSGGDGEYIKVNQDMGDLKTILGQISHETRFVVWAVTSQNCETFNMQAKRLPRSEGKKWAEVAKGQIGVMSDVLYLVMVDPLWGEDHPTRRITIFRHPAKGSLKGVIEQVCELYGINTHWHISSCK